MWPGRVFESFSLVGLRVSASARLVSSHTEDILQALYLLLAQLASASFKKKNLPERGGWKGGQDTKEEVGKHAPDKKLGGLTRFSAREVSRKKKPEGRPWNPPDTSAIKEPVFPRRFTVRVLSKHSRNDGKKRQRDWTNTATSQNAGTVRFSQVAVKFDVLLAKSSFLNRTINPCNLPFNFWYSKWRHRRGGIHDKLKVKFQV